ncbi:H-NS family nucleoid-associated regulatory protein [Cupriavidus taiwanensis]|uniref:H-NS family nucleoid-associated regulatory protein n=1 Tax=Cupriavidus taiwanensis TaxID=164546 RepID=UPI000E206A99
MAATAATTKRWTANTARAAAIRWIQAAMANYGLTMEELAPAPPPVVCYRNAAGQKWNGQGEMSDWLQRAVNAGQSKDFFRIG